MTGIKCYEGVWMKYLGVVLFFICVYVIGIPLGLLHVLNKYRKKGELHGERAVFTERRFGKVYKQYKPVVILQRTFPD